MNLVFVAVYIAACSAAKLDRTYLPPASAVSAGGSPSFLQAPFGSAAISPGFLQVPFARISETIVQNVQLPTGSYVNDHQGIVVDAASPGTRASNQPSGLGGPRPSYGSTDSKVGEAAFRGTKNQGAAQTPSGHGTPNQIFQTQFDQGQVDVNNPDLSAFYQPPHSVRPPIQIFRDHVSNTIKYHNNIGPNNYNYGFETENGIKMEGNGVSEDGVKAQGGYSYTGDDGKVYSIVYTADKNGYKPMGTHLPTPPPIPVEILQSLQQNAKDDAVGMNDDGSYDAQKYNEEDDYTKSDANGKYNDRQSNEFGVRPGSNDGASGSFINQDQQVFVQPNIQGQVSTFDSSKDSAPFKPDSFGSGVGVSGFDNTANNGNNLAQNGPNNQLNNRFDSQNQYLPPVGNVQGSFERPSTTFVKPSSYDISTSGQVSSNNRPPSSPGSNDFAINNNIPSTVDQTFNNEPLQGTTSQNVNPQNDDISIQFGQANLIGSQPSSGISGNNQVSQNNYDSLSLPVDSNFDINPSQGNVNNIPVSQNSQNSDISIQLGQTSLGSQPSLDIGDNTQVSQNNYGSSSLPIDSKFEINPSQGNINKIPASQFSTNFPQASTSDELVDNKNQDVIRPISSFSSEQTVLPTKQPQLTLTTPLEDQSQSISTDSKYPSFNTAQFGFNNAESQSPTTSTPDSASIDYSTSIFGSPTQKPDFVNDDVPQSNIQEPNYNQLNNRFTGQVQGLDNSYIYNKPSQPFNIPTRVSPNRVNQPSSTSPGSLFPNTPTGSVFSSQYPELTGSSKYTGSPTLAPIAPTLPTSKDYENKENTYQTNGVTQASISPFPPVAPTLPSNLDQQNAPFSIPNQAGPTISEIAQIFSTKPDSQNLPQFVQDPFSVKDSDKQSEEIYEYNNPSQGLPTSSQNENIDESNSAVNQQSSSPSSQNEDSKILNDKPQAETQSNIQLGQVSSIPQKVSTSFGQQTIPSHFGVQTGSIFGQSTIPSRFGVQASTPFGQQTTPSPFGIQTGSVFGQSIIPSRFGVPTSSSFGQKITSSPYGTQTGSVFGQSSLPSRFGVQTSRPFGQQTTPSPFGIQTGSVFGQSTIPSRFGVQTSLPFGQQTTPSPFGIQTGSTFGQSTIPSRFGVQTNSPFGQQTTPSRFGIQPSQSFGQKITPSRFGVQTNSPFGQQTAPSRFGVQTGTLFGQSTPSTYVPQTNSLFGYQTVPSKFGIQPSSPTGQQTTSSQFGIQPSSPTGQQTTSSQFGIQSSSSVGQKPTPSGFGIQSSSSFDPQKLPSRFGIQSSLSVGQQTTPSPFGVQSNLAFGQKTTPSGFDLPTSSTFEQKPTSTSFNVPTSSSFGQNTSPQLVTKPNKQSDEQSVFQKENLAGPDQQSQFQDPNVQSETSYNVKPTTLPSTSISQSFQDLTQTTDTSEVYEYNKPTISFSNDGNNAQSISVFGHQFTIGSDKNEPSQFGTKPDKQFSTQTESISSQKEPTAVPNQQAQDSNRFGQPQTEQQTMSGSPFASQQPITPELDQQKPGQSFNGKEPVPSQFSQTSPDTTAQYQPSTSLPTSPISQSSFNLQTQDPSQTPQSDEVYQYNKPDSSQNDNDDRFGQKEQQTLFTGQPDVINRNTFDTTKPITSHLSQNNENNNVQSTEIPGIQAQSVEQDSQTDKSPETTLTQDNLSGFKPFGSRPQLSFQSACCRVLYTQNNQGSSSQGGNFNGNRFGSNKNDQGSIGSGLKGSKFGNQRPGSTGIPDFGSQKGSTPNFAGKGEQFGGPRKPPSFDGTGYHY